MIKLKNQIFNVLKLLLIVHILISSGAALYGQITGSQIDPIKAILKFQTQPQNTRDTSQEKDVEYTTWQKLKSTVYGAITGKFFDKYSAYGAISSDYTVVWRCSEILAIQSWRYLTGEKTDVVVVTLSASGIVLSVVPNLFKTIYLKGFYKNPIAILGLSKSHLVLHTLKILKKYKLIGIAVPLLSLFLILSALPPYVTAVVFVASVAYLMVILFQIFKIKGESYA